MKLNHLIAPALASFATFSSAQNPPGDILDILRANGCEDFATFLETRAPVTLGIIRSRDDLKVWAPPNGALSNSNNTTTRKLFKRSPGDEAKAAADITYAAEPPPGKTPPGKTPKRQELPDSNFEIIKTILNDPAFINIGPNGYLKYVSNYASPKGGASDTTADLEIQTGLAKQVNTIGDAIKYNRGIIYKVSDWFNLPATLSDSLSAGGLTAFQQAIEAANLKEELDTKARITVFAPKGDIASNGTVEGQIIDNFLGYTPELESGHTYISRAGSPITVRQEGGFWYANSCKIVEPNVPIKNGVAHYCEDSSSPTSTPVGPSNTSLPAQFEGAAMTTGSPARVVIILGFFIVAAVVLM